MSASGASADDITNSKAFAQGRSWSSIIKKLLRDRKFTPPNIKELAPVQVASLTPERAGFIYGLTSFMINGKHKKGTYGEFLKRVYAGENPEDLLTDVFGYEKIEDFEKDWYAYMRSSKFR